jgi:uncharacterized membrane protein
MTAWALLGLSGVGFVLSLYFSLVYYGRVETGTVPRALCRQEEASCLTILATPYARLLGVPNALVGVGFYLLIAATAMLFLTGRFSSGLWQLSRLSAVAAVGLAPYLIWALRVRLRTWCWL